VALKQSHRLFGEVDKPGEARSRLTPNIGDLDEKPKVISCPPLDVGSSRDCRKTISKSSISRRIFYDDTYVQYVRLRCFRNCRPVVQRFLRQGHRPGDKSHYRWRSIDSFTGKKGFSAPSAVVTLACPKGAIEDCMSLLVLWNPFRNRTWH